MADFSIDLSPIIRAVDVVNDNLAVVNRNLGAVRDQVGTVAYQVDGLNSNVEAMDTKLEQLAQDFMVFVRQDAMDKELQRAMTDIIRIRQELDKKFGNYDDVRNRTTGILQAVDVSLVRKETIANCTEELMLATPRYWLAPCLIALSAWISNNRELAERAINEALKRDDEKSSLLFALISRRGGRLNASEVWLERYLSMQDPTALERDMVVVIDAYANGLFGGDSHGSCSKQIRKWINELSEQVGFVEDQHRQWSDALLSKLHGGHNIQYQYLTKYSPTWGQLNSSLTDVRLHQIILDYFQSVFAGTSNASPNLAASVDALLDNLVTNFDEEELPLRREERIMTLVIEERGDRKVAVHRYDLEKIALSSRFSFTQLLTNAAMHPETSNSSKATQRLAVAMSKDWIINAYEDVTAKIRARIPLDIKIQIEDWNGTTRDGSNENELVYSLGSHVDNKLAKAIEGVKLDVIQWIALVVGILLVLYGIVSPRNFYIIFVGLAGCAWFGISFMGLNKKRDQLREEYAKLKGKMLGILKGTLAESVDVRREISAEDAKYDKVIQFIEAITPQQFISTNHTSRMIA